MQAKRPALVTQKDLFLSATRWKLVRMEFPGGVRKRFPVAVIEHTCHAPYPIRFEITFAPVAEDSLVGRVEDLYISRACHLVHEDARDLFRDMKLFEDITRGRPPEMKFVVALDKIIENAVPGNKVADYGHLLEARKAYFNLLEKFYTVTGMGRPWVDAGPEILS